MRAFRWRAKSFPQETFVARGRATVAVLALIISVLALAPVAPARAAGECPSGWTFNAGAKTCAKTWATAAGQSTSGSSYSWTVPSGVTSLSVTVIGAHGGYGGNDSAAGGAPGQVGQVTGSLPVSAGASVALHIGGIGTNGGTCQDWCGMGYGGDNPIGAYGGGNGANAGCTYDQCGPYRGSSGAGGGGGAASVLVVGSSTIVAAGGGGGGGGSQFTTGSAGRTGAFVAGTVGGSADNWGPNHPYAGVGGGGGGGASGGAAGLAAGVAQGQGNSQNADNYSAQGGSAGSNSTASIAGLSASFVAAQTGSISITFTPQLAPVALTSPTVAASPVAGSSTSGTNATFAGLAGTNTLQWLVCDSSASTSNTATSLSLPAGCTLATGAGANSLAYTPVAADAGKYLRLASTMTNSEGTYTSISATSTNPVALPATTVDLTAPSDLGTSSTDNITSDDTPAIVAGNLIVGATVTLTASNGTATQSCTFVAISTTQGCDLGTMLDGIWTVSSSQASNGVSTVPTTMSMTVDTVAPDVTPTPDLAAASDTGSSSTDDLTADSTPFIEVPGVANGVVVTVTASRPGFPDVTCTYTTPTTGCSLGTLADGPWDVVATTNVTDVAGNPAPASAPLPIMVRTTAASGLAVDLAESSDTGSSSIDDVTRLQTVMVGVPGVTDGSSVTMTGAMNGQSNVTCTYVASATVTGCLLGTLAEGVWNVSADVTDPGIGVTSAVPALPVTVDITAPVAPAAPDLAASSDTGASQTDNLTRDDTPRIEVPNIPTGRIVTVTAARPGFAPVSCTYLASATVNGCDLPSMADGPWSVTATMTDIAGNESPASYVLEVIVDTVAPYALVAGGGTSPVTTAIGPSGSAPSTDLPDLLAVSDTGVSSTDNVTTESDPWVSMPSATAGQSVTMTMKRAGHADVTCTYVVSATVTSCRMAGLATGKWSLTATTTDLAGNTGTSAPVAVTVSDIAGLPAVDRTEVVATMTAGPRLTTVQVSVPQRAGAVAVRRFVVAVMNASGRVMRTVTIAVKPGQSSASFTVPSTAGAARVMAYATNGFGVSDRAPTGAAVRHRKPTIACPHDGSVSYTASNLFDRVIFDPASPALDRGDRAILDKVAAHLKGRGGMVIVSGYARKNGIDSARFLRNLSLQRARNVSMYLSTRGVRAWVDFEGYGAVTKRIGTPIDRRVDVCWTESPDPAFP